MRDYGRHFEQDLGMAGEAIVLMGSDDWLTTHSKLINC